MVDESVKNAWLPSLDRDFESFVEFNPGDDSVGIFELLGPGYSGHLSLVEPDFVGYAYDHGLAFLDVPGEHQSGTMSVGFDS